MENGQREEGRKEALEDERRMKRGGGGEWFLIIASSLFGHSSSYRWRKTTLHPINGAFE
jgi:hypothetical protein